MDLGILAGEATSVSVWVACGAGYYVLALVGAVLAGVILTVLGAVEGRIEGPSKTRRRDEGK